MKKILFGLIALYIVIYLLPLGGRPLVVPDEMRYGQMAKEMIDSGDWIVPRLMNLRYFEKPAMGHWMNAGGILLFGEGRVGARFASAVSVGLAALALFLMVRKERGEKTALLASFILLTCAEVHFVGTYSSLDSMVASFITLSLCCFYPAVSAEGKKRAGWLLLTGLFVGCAFLVKGFLAIAIPVMVIAPFLILQKRWKDLGLMPWLPLAGILIVTLPWSIAIALREPDYWHYFFFEEHIHRFFAKEEAEHAAPFWYFIPILLAGALPWTLIAPIPLFKTVKEKWADPLVRFCVLWAALPFLFFSASSGKLGTYILPCFPPLATLLAIGLLNVAEETKEKYFRVGAWIFFSIFALGFVAIGTSALLPIEAIKFYDPFERYKYAIALVGLIVTATLAFNAIKNRTRNRRIIALGLAMAAGIVTTQFCIPENHSVPVSMNRFLNDQSEHMPDNALVITDTRCFTAVGYILGHPEAYITGGQGELDYGLAYEDAAHRFLGWTPQDVLPFFEAHNDQPIVIVTRDNRIESILDRLPPPNYEASFRYLRFYVFNPSEKGSL